MIKIKKLKNKKTLWKIVEWIRQETFERIKSEWNVYKSDASTHTQGQLLINVKGCELCMIGME